MFFRARHTPQESGGDTITLESLRAHLADGRLGLVMLRGQAGGFAVEAHVDGTARRLGTASGIVRVFSGVAAAAILLRELGIERYAVDTAGYSRPASLRAAHLAPLQRVERRASRKSPTHRALRGGARSRHEAGEVEIERWLAAHAR